MTKKRFLLALALMLFGGAGAWAQGPTTVFEVDFSSTPTATTGSMRIGSMVNTTTVMINESANSIYTIRLGAAYNYSTNRYVSIKPETGSFQTGDTLLIAVCYSNSNTKTAKAAIYAANGTTLLFTTAPGINGQNESGDPVVEKFVLEQDADSLLIGRSSSADIVTYVTTLKVLRPAADQAIELTKVGANQWQFTMPAYDVELEVEYYEQVEGVVANQDPDKTSDYWCTYYNPTTNVKVSTAGVSIYKAALSGETLALSKVDGNVIKGGQAVVLKSTVGGELEMEETPDDATGDYTGNELKGTTEAINGNGKIYVLNYTQENGVGFYQLSANGTLGANKAYLEYNGSNARAFFSFGFDDETSGIENTSSTDDTNRGEVYDLQGRQVKQPARGLYIKSGKKVVIK